jgi:hypothetical protein
MIDSVLHSSGLSRVIPLTAKRKKSIGIFDVDDELGEGETPEKTASEPIQTPHKIQGLSLLNLSNIKNSPTPEIISYVGDVLDQLKTLQYQLLEGEVSYELLQKLEGVLNGCPNSFNSLPLELHGIIEDIQVRVAVELTKLSINRT